MENSENARACPKCGSANIKYELRSAGTTSKTNYYRTGVKSSFLVPAGKKSYESRKNLKSIGFCQNCGHYWEVESDSPNNIGCGFFLLCFMFWPIALSIWFYRTDKIKLEKGWRIVIISVFMIVVLIWAKLSSA